MLKNYLTIAYRHLKRQPGYAAINIAGLAIGLAVCLLIGLYVRHKLSYDRFHEQADRIYRVLYVSAQKDGSEQVIAQTPIPLATAMEEALPEVQRVLQLRYDDGVAIQANRPFDAQLLFADSTFFDVFTFPLTKGNSATALDAPGSVVLTPSAARKYFGNEEVLGRRLTIRLRGKTQEVTVTGVMRSMPNNSSIQFDALLPMSVCARLNCIRGTSWRTLAPHTYVQLPEKAQAADLEAKLPAFIKRYVPKENAPYVQFRLQPLTDIHLTPGFMSERVPTTNPLYIYILSGIAGLILLIACINFMTLSVGRSTRRAREVGMRKVLGAVRPQIMRQFWGEALLLTSLALLVGLTLAAIMLPLFENLIGQELSFHLGAPMTLAGIVGLLLVVGLLAGGYPAVVLSGFQPTEVLKGRLRLGKNRVTRGLVVVQFALSIFLIISTLFMSRQLDLMQTKELGFDEEQVVRVEVPQREGIKLLRRYKQALTDESRVLHVSGSWNRLGSGDGVGFHARAATSGNVEIQASGFQVVPDFLETLGIKLVAGRGFPDLKSRGGVVVNEALVEAFGWEAPLEQKISQQFAVKNAPVVGVVENFHFQSLHHQVEPLFMHIGAPLTNLYVRVAPGDVTGALDVLRGTWQEIAPELPFDYTFLDEAVEQQYRTEQRWAKIIGWASGFAIFIACLGLFGLATLAAARRTKEIGIRKVFGASVTDIVTLLSKDFAALVLVAFVVAVPVAYYAVSRWLEAFAYRIELGPWTFAAAGLGVLVLALATVSYQAVKAALANPVDAIRYE